MTNVKKKRKIHKFKRSSKPKPLTDDSGGDNVLGTNKFRSLLRDSVLRRCTKFHKDDAKQCLATATTVVNSLIQKMKIDPLFQRLYQYTYNSGSYFKGTKVTAPREFDFNLVFKIPMPSSVWKNEDIKGHDYLTGYSMFRFEGKPTHLEEIESEFKSYSGDDNRKQREASPSKSSTSKIYQFEKYLLDTDGDCQYLSCAKILTWMQSLVDKVINKIKEELDADDLTISVSNKRRSPALTLIIGKKQMEDDGTKKKRKKPTNIDIDLVPVIKYQSLFGKHATYELPDHINRKLFTKENKDEEPTMIQAMQSIFLVPKCPPEEILFKLPDEQREMVKKFAWRFSFPGLEKAILYKKGCVKTLIRLFKVLRDKQNWDKISSYFIETIFYWKINQFPSSDKWEEWHLGKLFIKMLKVISEAMVKQKLPHFFFPRMNLLAAVNKETISTISNCMKNINSQIRKTENSVYSIYKIEKRKTLKPKIPSVEISSNKSDNRSYAEKIADLNSSFSELMRLREANAKERWRRRLLSNLYKCLYTQVREVFEMFSTPLEDIYFGVKSALTTLFTTCEVHCIGLERMLKVISEAMAKQELPHFFFPRMNLLSAVNKETISTISNCLKNINSQIKKTENSIYSIYKIEKQKAKRRTTGLSAKAKLTISTKNKLIEELLSVTDLKLPKDHNNFINSSDDGCLAVSAFEEDVYDYVSAFEEDVYDYDSLAVSAFEEDVYDYVSAFEEDVYDYDSLAVSAFEDDVYDIF